MKKPLADDWVAVHEGVEVEVEYSKRLDLYWSNGRVYDRLSATHNGIVGAGRDLREAIAKGAP